MDVKIAIVFCFFKWRKNVNISERIFDKNWNIIQSIGPIRNANFFCNPSWIMMIHPISTIFLKLWSIRYPQFVFLIHRYPLLSFMPPKYPHSWGVPPTPVRVSFFLFALIVLLSSELCACLETAKCSADDRIEVQFGLCRRDGRSNCSILSKKYRKSQWLYNI